MDDTALAAVVCNTGHKGIDDIALAAVVCNTGHKEMILYWLLQFVILEMGG